MGEFIRDRLPDAVGFFDAEDVQLVGPGRWKTGPCHFHGGSDSLRVNVQSGAFCCMACGVKGGDVLAYTMQRHGMEFVQAARSLGTYAEDGKPHQGQAEPTTLSARAAMELAALDLQTALLVISDIKGGVIPSPADWQCFIGCAARVGALAEEYRA